MRPWRNELQEYRNDLMRKICHLQGSETYSNQYSRMRLNWLKSEIINIEYFFFRSVAFYETALEWMKLNNMKSVVDIGCGSAFQAEMFEKNGIRYYGIEENSAIKKWRKDCHYILDKYPCQLNEIEKHIAISRLCIGYYPCDYRILAKDFQFLIIDNIKDFEKINQYFWNVAVIPCEDANPDGTKDVVYVFESKGKACVKTKIRHEKSIAMEHMVGKGEKV